ncbi:hypothetical protein TruAng_007400 [Truncatella angustata]|nr:hypothetical protein TruAng_007400 [Truncatella angustata]
MVQFNGPHGKISDDYLRNARLNPPTEPTQTFEGKTVLVTGCTRTVAKGEATKSKILGQVSSLESHSIEVFAVEYTSFLSVNKFVAAVKRSTQTLDCAILSAGVVFPEQQLGEDGWDTAIKVNVLSTALLAIELLPLLKATPSSVLEFVSSVSYCNVTSEDLAAILREPSANTLQFFNDSHRWTKQRGYCEAKLLLMLFIRQLATSLGGEEGRPGNFKSPIVLACCPGQCKTDLFRNFPSSARAYIDAIGARSAEEGSRTLVSGLLQGEKANGRMWVNDQFDDWSPGLSEKEWEALQQRVWVDLLAALREHSTDVSL